MTITAYDKWVIDNERLAQIRRRAGDFVSFNPTGPPDWGSFYFWLTCLCIGCGVWYLWGVT